MVRSASGTGGFPLSVERNVEAFVGAFHIGNGAGGLHRESGIGKALRLSRKKRRTSARYFSLRGTTTRNALASFDWIARGTSAGAIFLKLTLPARSYSLFRASTTVAVDLAADHADRVALQFLDAGQPPTPEAPGSSRPICSPSTTLRAWDRSPTSALTIARSVLPAANSFAESSTLSVRHDLDVHGGFRRIEPAGHKRGELGCLAVE